MQVWRVFLASMVMAMVGPGAWATGFLAYQQKQACLACHQDPRGRTGLTERGEEARDRGYRFGRDPALVVPKEWGPHSPGGQRMLVRRYFERGRRLFHEAGLGRVRKSCASCHAGPEALAGVTARYPKPSGGMGEWTTLEEAIDRCLVDRMGTDRLHPGSRSSLALQVYLRDRIEREHPGLASVGLPGGVEAEDPDPIGPGDPPPRPAGSGDGDLGDELGDDLEDPGPGPGSVSGEDPGGDLDDDDLGGL